MNIYSYCLIYNSLGFPGGSDGKESACNVGDPGLISGLRISPEEGNGNPLQYSCLENSMDRSLAGYSPWDCKESDLTEKFSPLLSFWWLEDADNSFFCNAKKKYFPSFIELFLVQQFWEWLFSMIIAELPPIFESNTWVLTIEKLSVFLVH